MAEGKWTEEEVAFLQDNNGKMPWSQIALKLNRSKDAIQKKVKLLKEQSGEMEPEAIDEINDKLARENRELRDKLDAMNKYEDVLCRTFKKVIKDAPPIPQPVRYMRNSTKGSKHACQLGFEFSDLQMGMFIKPEDTVNLGGYSFDIFKRRLQKFKEVVITIAEEQRMVRPIEDLIIFGLGDYVEGEQIYPSQALFIDLCVADQFINGVNEISAFLRDLACYFRRVKMYGVWGNHGRLGRFGHGHPKSNMDYLLLKTLQMRLEPVKNIDIYTSTGPAMAVQIYDEIHLLRHGEDTNSWCGIPFYGMERDTLKYANLIRLPIEHAHVGHHHRQASWEVSVMSIHMNGSFCGPTPFGISKMKMADRPSQSIFMLHPEHGMNWRVPIWLEKNTPMVKDSNGIFTPYT